MYSNEQIAHDLALLWVQEAIEGNVSRQTEDQSVVEEYLSAYQDFLAKLNSTRTPENG